MTYLTGSFQHIVKVYDIIFYRIESWSLVRPEKAELCDISRLLDKYFHTSPNNRSLQIKLISHSYLINKRAVRGSAKAQVVDSKSQPLKLRSNAVPPVPQVFASTNTEGFNKNLKEVSKEQTTIKPTLTWINKPVASIFKITTSLLLHGAQEQSRLHRVLKCSAVCTLVQTNEIFKHLKISLYKHKILT